MILPIVQSRFVSIALALVLIAFAIYDIYDELFDPAHEHILMIVGVFMVIGSFGHLNEGVNKLAHIVKPERNLNALEKIAAFYRLPVVRILLGLTVIVTATYGLVQDVEKIETKSVSLGIGILTMIGPAYKGFTGGEKVVSAVKKEEEK